MNELVYLKNDEAVCSSLQVAEKFGKRHDRVLRAIDNLLETLPKNGEVSKMFILSKRKAADGQFHRMYFMNRDGFSLLVMGFTGKKEFDEKSEEVEYKDVTEKKAIYYEQDAPYIISAFRREYQVNLLSVPYMHWWEFRMLLDGLNEESQIKKRIYWRTCDVSKMEKKERMEILKIRRSINRQSERDGS